MAIQKKYLGILEGRPAEFQALSQFGAPIGSAFLPLVRLVPQAKLPDKPTDARARILAKVAKDLSKIRSNWPWENPILLDVFKVRSKLATLSEEPRKHGIFDMARGIGPSFVAVEKLTYESSTGEHVDEHLLERGLGVQIDRDMINAGFRDPKALNDAISQIVVAPEQTDLIFDYGPCLPGYLFHLPEKIRRLFQRIPNIGGFRSVFFASGALPQTFQKLRKDGADRLPRNDMRMFEQSISGSEFEDIVFFGDYTAMSPRFYHLDRGNGKFTPTLRYTWRDYWHFERGNTISPTRPADLQFKHLAERLIGNRVYRGPNFSRSDSMIFSVAQGHTVSKNRQFYTQIAIEHHIAETLDYLAA